MFPLRYPQLAMGPRHTGDKTVGLFEAKLSLRLT